MGYYCRIRLVCFVVQCEKGWDISIFQEQSLSGFDEKFIHLGSLVICFSNNGWSNGDNGWFCTFSIFILVSLLSWLVLEMFVKTQYDSRTLHLVNFVKYQEHLEHWLNLVALTFTLGFP